MPVYADDRMLTDSPALGMSPDKEAGMDDSGIGLSLQFEDSDAGKGLLGTSVGSRAGVEATGMQASVA
jgi:hypothetical protein